MLLNKRLMAGLLVILAALLVVTTGCGASKANNEGNTQGSAGNNNTAATEPPKEDGPELLGSDKHPVVTIEMSNDKVIKVELYPEVAPNTVNNFISLVQSGFYDGVIFHRVIPGFMIQGGDPEGTGTGGPGYSIAGEFTDNGFENKLKHTRGVISMARTGDPNSAGSQFFIMHEDYPSLNNQYASFGKVIEGLDVVDEIVGQEQDASNKPLDPLSMKKVTVDTKGMTFEAPKKVE